MKKYLFITLSLILGLLSFNSCKEDIVLTGERKETAIIYCLLDQSEDIHFVKINRSFIGPGNALDFAQIPDSNYFEHVDAYVYECLGNDTLRTWILKDTTIENKSTSGVFYAPTEKLYYFSTSSQASLNENATFKLNVIINKDLTNEFTVSGQTKLVTGIASAQAQPGTALSFMTQNNQYSTAYLRTTSNGTGNAYILNAALNIKMYEYYGATLHDSVEIHWNSSEKEVENNTIFSSPLQGITFYELIRDNVTNDPLIDKRQIQEITIKLTGGSEVLKEYINSNKPSNSLAQTKPSYTNLSITNNKNVVGIFSARSTVTVVKKIYNTSTPTFRAIDNNSTKELCTGPITGPLFFCSQHNLDALQTYYCP